ncbi:hypothetical protein K431DRAFT_288772 [Polychaeton citri CBS 116435]|uniref:Uncharacterized protein n=1 Tax=Polychaeton citri CBS 116435 TaxID=1314669 RepID=A0A9P4Q0J7_9PEZI|nr:hypothetical protein K431DRAFT_288772 [Polychaeton citri CBS 116435]
MEHFLQPRDPRFRRRINEIGQSIEDAEEAACSNIYIFGQRYIRPCFAGIGNAVTTCVDASCPSLNLTQRDRIRRQRGRSGRGRAELSFDFYDDWDDLIEGEGLLGWGGGETLEGSAGAGVGGGYGTLAGAQQPSQTQQQPGRQKGMSYSKSRSRRKSGAADGRGDGAGRSWLAKLFGTGNKAIKYEPTTADLQEHPGSSRPWDRGDRSEADALLADDETGRRHHRHDGGRKRSGTASSADTSDSLSSRGDLFPSDEEDDAVPLDDEFAMVLERRTTQSGSGGPETESTTSGKLTRSSSSANNLENPKRRGKRPSLAGSRASTRRTMSTRSERSSLGRRKSGNGRRSRRSSNGDEQREAVYQHEISSSPIQTRGSGADSMVASISSLAELTLEEARLAQEEEDEIERKREEAKRLAGQRGLVTADVESSAAVEVPDPDVSSSKEATPHATRAASVNEEPSQLPTPVPTDDEDDGNPGGSRQERFTSKEGKAPEQ